MNEANRSVFRPINPGRAELIKTYHFQGYLRPTAEFPTPLDCLNCAREITLSWIQQKYPDDLPDAMLDGQPDHMEEHGQVIETEAFEQQYWALRNEMPDSGIDKKIPPVAGRSWITEIAFYREGPDDVRVHMAVYCRNLPMAKGNEIHILRPRIIRDLIETGMVWADGLLLSPSPWHIKNRSDLDALFQLAVNPNRKMPLVICGERTVPNITTGFNHEEFAGNIAGIAHWVVLDHAQMTSWNLQVGATARMEPGWVRIYYPGFEPNHPRNEALHRPYTNPTDETQQFEDYHGIHYGAEAFQRFIKKHLCTYIRHAILDRGFVPSISEVRNRRIQQERADSPADAQALDLYNKEIEQLRRQIEELNLLLQASEEEKALLARQKEEEAGKLHQEIAQLRGRLIALNTKRASEPVSEWRDMVPPEEECTWERLVDWVNTELAGRLILLPRTHKMIREAEYENPRLAYEALALLAGPYRDMNLGSKRDQARKQWENGLSSLHLAEEPSLGESKKGGNNAEDYRVKYEDKNFLLERHLKKGNSWERRYCFRVYYCFDDREEHKVVLVGGIPHHLSTDYS